MEIIYVIVGIFGTFLSTIGVMGLKWFYAHMKSQQKFREETLIERVENTNMIKGLRNDIIKSHDSFTEMFAEELHPINDRVGKLKSGLNKVEEKIKLPKTSFEK